MSTDEAIKMMNLIGDRLSSLLQESGISQFGVVVIYSNFPPQIPNTRLYHTGQNCNIDILPTKHCDFHHFFAVFLPSKGPNTRSIPVLVTNQVLPDFLASVGFMRGGILPYPLHACCTVIGAFPHNAAASDADITSSNAFSLKSS